MSTTALKSNSITLACIKISHSDQQACAVCIEKTCSKKGFVCIKCLLEEHQLHFQNCIPINDYLMTVRNGIFTLAKNEEFKRFLQSAHQQQPSTMSRSSAFDLASTKESLKSLKAQLVQFIENYMDKAIKDLEKGVASQAGSSKNSAVTLTEKFNSFGELFSKMENLQKANAIINEETVDAARLNRLCVYFSDYVEFGENDKKLRFLQPQKIQKILNSSLSTNTNSKRAEEFAQNHYEKVLLKVKKLLESTEAVLGESESEKAGEDAAQAASEPEKGKAQAGLQEQAEILMPSPECEESLGPKINKISAKRSSPMFKSLGLENEEDHPSIITINTSIDSKENSLVNILNTLKPCNLLKLDEDRGDKFIEYPKYDKFEKYETKYENIISNSMAGKHLMTTPPKENPFKPQRHSSKKSKENYSGRETFQSSSQNQSVGSVGSIREIMNPNPSSGSVGPKDYQGSFSGGSQFPCTSRLQFRSLQHFCDAIEVSYLSVWSLSFRVLRDNISLHGFNHFPIFVYNNSYTSSLNEADLDVALIDGTGLQGRVLCSQTYKFKRTNLDSNESDYLQRIVLKKTIKLRRNCVYSLVITNISEDTIENDNKLFFCFGDEITTKCDKFEYSNTDMRGVQSYKVDGEEVSSQLKNKRDTSPNQPTDLFVQSLVISETPRTPHSGKGMNSVPVPGSQMNGYGEGQQSGDGSSQAGNLLMNLFSKNSSENGNYKNFQTDRTGDGNFYGFAESDGLRNERENMSTGYSSNKEEKDKENINPSENSQGYHIKKRNERNANKREHAKEESSAFDYVITKKHKNNGGISSQNFSFASQSKTLSENNI